MPPQTGGFRTTGQQLFDRGGYPAEWFTDQGFPQQNTGSTRHDQELTDFHKFWSPDAVRHDMLRQAELTGQGTRHGPPNFTDEQVHAEWVKRNTHATNYRTDPDYRAEWHASRGDGSTLGQLFNAAVLGTIGAGFGTELFGAGAANPVPTGPDAGSFPTPALPPAVDLSIAGGVGAGVDPITGNAVNDPLSIGSTPGSGLSNLVPPGVDAITGGPVDPLSLGNTSDVSLTGTPAVLSDPTGAGAIPAAVGGSEGLSGLINDSLTGSDLGDLLTIGGSSLLSGYLSNEATEAGIDEIRRQFDLTRSDQEPFRQAGVTALGQLQEGINQPVDEFSFSLEDDPGFNFARDEALRATERAAAARGFNNSGNLLAELNDRASGMAAQHTNDAFNRQIGSFNTNRGVAGDRLNRLASLAGVGQTAVSNTGVQGANAASNLANLHLQQGQGINNAIQGGLTNYLLNRR